MARILSRYKTIALKEFLERLYDPEFKQYALESVNPIKTLEITMHKTSSGEYLKTTKKKTVKLDSLFQKLEFFFFCFTLFIQKFAFKCCFLLMKNCRRFFKIFTLFVFADNAFFFNHAFKAFDSPFKVLRIFYEDCSHLEFTS